LRGERCEGLYIREVAGNAGLLVASFTEPYQLADFTSGQRVRLEWSPPGDTVVRLRAVALKRRLYYRMDALSPAASRFDWPVDVLSALELRQPDVGVVGWFDRPIAGRVEPVYLPLRIGAAGTPVARTGRYIATLVPGAELTNVFVSLSAIDDSGRDAAATVLQRDEPLQQGPYPAGRAIRIALPALTRAGLYRLNVGAVLARGSPTNRTILFFHAGGLK
jgi:hypothetical protein